MNTLFYKIVKPFVKVIFTILYRPTVIGKENIPKSGPIVLAGNHTNYLDPIMLVAITNRQVHFLAKDSLFKGAIKPIVKGMGAIPVNRKIHDKGALYNAEEYLKQSACIGIFPEGTINRTNDIIMPFKIGAVKMSKDCNSQLIPFIITGKYKLFRKSIKIEFLKPRKVTKDLEIENKKLMTEISKKLEENDEKR